MGLKADIDEVLTSWEKSPWWMKAWLVLSAFLAVSSIASISEAIVKWKGFFKDAIEFYRLILVSPLRDALSSLNIDINPIRGEVLVLVIISFMILVRYLYIVSYKHDQRWWRYMSILAVFMIALIAQWIYRANGNYESFNWPRNIIGLLGGLFVLPLVLKMEKPMLYFGQWIMFFSIVALLAGINSGLSR